MPLCPHHIVLVIMAEILDPKHEAFTIWAKEQGVKVNGVAPAKLTGKGFGIVATRRLKVRNKPEIQAESNINRLCRKARLL